MGGLAADGLSVGKNGAALKSGAAPPHVELLPVGRQNRDFRGRE
jgi:hypothetical protein